MQYRLQTMRPAAAEAANGFDLTFWRQATTLDYFGAELCVSQGAVTISLRHRHAEGQDTEVALLECPFPNSAFSPPFRIADLAQAGGQLVPVIVDCSDDAQFDLYFGTNDLPATPKAQLAIIMPPASPEVTQALEQGFADFQRRYSGSDLAHRCQLLLPQGRQQGWLRQALHALAYGSYYGRLQPANPAQDTASYNVQNPSHVAVLPSVLDDKAEPCAEYFIRALALAEFLQPHAIFHVQDSPAPWPESLFDLRQVFRHGLPFKSLSHFMTRLANRGCHRQAANGVLPPETTSPSRILERLAQPRPPGRLATRIKLDQADQIHQLHKTQANDLRQMEQRLQHNHLWDQSQVQADLNRSNQTLLSVLRQRHQGQRAVIVGNGPSLTYGDLSRLKNTVSFGSNKIYLAYNETRWRPTYYSVEDHLVLTNNRAEIEALSGSIKLFPANLRDFGYHASDTIFAPFLPPLSFQDPLSDPNFPAFSRDLSHGIAWGSTIVYSQIQMALYMGCSDIVLIGLDHSYQLPSVKQGNQYVHEGERNHFHPKYRAPGEVWHQPNLDVLERSYARARDVCTAAGVTIRNASRQTQLTVFERADFDQIFPLSEVPA